MIRMMEGWLDRMDGEWEVITTSNGEKAEPCESPINHEESDEKGKERNQGEIGDGNVSVASLEQQVRCPSVLQSDGRVLLSSTCASRGSNQSPAAEFGIESTGENAYSRVVETSPGTTRSRLGGRRIEVARQCPQQRTREKTPHCPVCRSTMQYKSARKGGFFYGCPRWPNCRVYRDPHGRNPGPKDFVDKQRALYGPAWDNV